MEIPIFHMDVLNNRVLIAVIAVLHVVINHAMAVGGIPLVAYLERRGLREPELGWDALAHRVLTVFFLVTTTLGALTGVGIWLSAGLVNPMAIGSLLRVFFWTWFVEWLVFVTEVLLILAYYLTWRRWTGPRKCSHVRLGAGLALASWATMALIVSILGFMMDPGSWHGERTLLAGMFNPMYLPQLAFRTPLAMVMGGAAALLITRATTRQQPALRTAATRSIGRWMLAWLPLVVAGGVWYANAVPDAMKAQLPVALVTQNLVEWAAGAKLALAAAAVAIAAVALWAALAPASLRLPAALLPALASVALIGAFERVREFVRKPYAIAGYLYANGMRVEDYPLLQRDGLLATATYTRVRDIDPDDPVPAGREVFTLACTRCHTTDGVNGVRAALARLYPAQRWEAAQIDRYLGAMHLARPFMPPFPGSAAERTALSHYLAHLQRHPELLEGAQDAGATYRPPRHAVGERPLVPGGI
jgi:mono/diheme cytochrome c family protein